MLRPTAHKLLDICKDWKLWSLPQRRTVEAPPSQQVNLGSPVQPMRPSEIPTVTSRYRDLPPGWIHWEIGGGYSHPVKYICGRGCNVLGQYEGAMGASVYVIGDPSNPRGETTRTQGPIEDAMRIYMAKCTRKDS